MTENENAVVITHCIFRSVMLCIASNDATLKLIRARLQKHITAETGATQTLLMQYQDYIDSCLGL